MVFVAVLKCMCLSQQALIIDIFGLPVLSLEKTILMNFAENPASLSCSRDLGTSESRPVLFPVCYYVCCPNKSFSLSHISSHQLLHHQKIVTSKGTMNWDEKDLIKVGLT